MKRPMKDKFLRKLSKKNTFFTGCQIKYFASNFQRIVHLPQLFILFMFISSIILGQGGEVEMFYRKAKLLVGKITV